MINEQPLYGNVEIEAELPVITEHPAEQVYSYGFEDYDATAHPAGEVVYTQNFESNSLGWSGVGSTTMSRTVFSGQTWGHGPSTYFAVVRSSTTTYAGTFQGQRTFTGLVVGRSYTLRAWVGKNGSSSPVSNARIGVSGIGWSAGIAPLDIATGVQANWKEISYTFTATATSHVVLVEHTTTGTSSSSGAAYWDDISLTGAAYTEVRNDGRGGWAVLNGGVQSTVKRSGNYALLLQNMDTGTPGDGEARYGYQTVVGRSYTIRAWVKGVSAGTSQVTLGITGEGSATASVTSASPWTEVTYTFTATSASHEVYLFTGGAAGGPGSYWDDVTVTGDAWTETNYEWSPLVADATSVTIHRGGVREGLGIKTDVGLLTFNLKDAEDPMAGGRMAPGQTVRAIAGNYEAPYDETVYTWGFESYNAVQHPPQVVYTEDFNDGLPDGWTPASGTSAAMNSTEGVDGTYAYRVYRTSTAGEIRSTRSFTGLEVGRAYTVTGQAKAGTEGTVTGVRIEVPGGWSTNVTVSGTYQQFEAHFTATATTQNLSLIGTASTSGLGAYIAWDNIVLTRDAWTEVLNDGLGGWSFSSEGKVRADAPLSGMYYLNAWDYVARELDVAATRTFTDLTVGHTYTLSAWCATWDEESLGVTGTGWVAVSGGTASAPVELDSWQTMWTKVEHTFTATATSHTLELHALGGDGWFTDVKWDDVKLVHHVPAVDSRTELFTGRVADLASVYPMNKSTGESHAMTRVTVADAVQIHGSTMRYGVDLGAATNETFEARIARLAQSSNAPIDVPPVGAPKEVYSF